MSTWWSFVAAIAILFLSAPSVSADLQGQPDGQRPITAMDLVLIRDIGNEFHGRLSISPDRQRLAFQLRRAELESNSSQTSWFIADTTEGGQLIRVGDGGEPIFSRGPLGVRVGTLSVETAKWSPDSQWVVYRRKQEGAIQLWRSRRDGTIQERLTDNPADVETFEWASDGTKIFFQVGRSRLSKALTDKEEGERGYLFDGSFTPFSAPRPNWGVCQASRWDRMPAKRRCSLSLWVFDLATGTERQATTLERDEYDELLAANRVNDVPEGRDTRAVARSPDGTKVSWLENEDPKAYPGDIPPLTVFASTPSELRCPADQCRGRFSKLWWSAGSDELYFLRREGAALSAKALYGWIPGDRHVRLIFRTTDLISDCHMADDRAICLHEGPTSPRRVVAIDLTDGTMETLVDPNPEFSDIQFTKVERLEWQDGFGNDTIGHLVYPVGYRKGQRYPFVIVQYTSRGFLRGGTGDEYPIHLLAAHGFAVLSFDRPADWQNMGKMSFGLEWEKKEWADLYEKRRALTALEAIIDRLDDAGLIDASRVGITGLSDGAETLYFSLIQTNRFAAASASAGSWEQALYYLSGETFLRDYLPAVGMGRPGGPNDRYWAENAVSLNAHRINAPLLVQTGDHELLGAGVETFIALKESGRPVEMFVFPNEHHIKWQPKHRYNIYRRNVQWFNFWLRGVEEPDPVDPEQYIRWRQLREQHQANQRAQEQAQRPVSPGQARSGAIPALDGE